MIFQMVMNVRNAVLCFAVRIELDWFTRVRYFYYCYLIQPHAYDIFAIAETRMQYYRYRMQAHAVMHPEYENCYFVQ